MKNKFITAGIFLLFLAVFVMPSIVQGQTGSQPFTCPDGTPAIFDGNQGFYCQNSNGAVTGAQGGEADGWSIANAIVGGVAKFIGQSLMSIAALVLSIAGYLFDGVMEYTVVNMSTKLGNGPGGLGEGITAAWATLRDIANMCFIFVLLFTAFKAMFELNFGNVGKTIKDIIIIALLINFSLFFTKVVIDTSNVVSTGFYNSIVTTNPVGAGSGTSVPSTDRTISGNYMRLLGLQSWWSPKALTVGINERADKILMVGVMSSIFFLVTAVILLITSVMFVARFILLIFLMILSPLAFIAYIIPGQKGQFEKWWQALINQSFFAPLFFAMTWVVFMVANGLKASVNLSGLSAADTTFIDAVSSSTAGGLGGHIGIILNFVIITGLSIAALVFSKQMASKTSGFTAISGGVGAVGAGGAAMLGRNTFGFVGKKFVDSSRLQSAATTKGWTQPLARLALYGSEKAQSSTFDVRNASVPTSVVGDAIRGTLGRTGRGKKIGLNDVNIPSVAIGERLGTSLLGKAGTKGYAELKTESDKRVRERDAATAAAAAAPAAAAAIEQNKKAVKAGASAPVPPPGTTDPLVEEMEKALSKLSDKETEALVASNKDLLKSQNFANAISVKQLEALNKSDQLSDTDKGNLKGIRFSKINAAMTAGGTGAASVDKDIRGLSDTELEMIDPEYLKKDDFVKELKSSQIDTIIKNNKFTTGQKDSVRNARKAPLLKALDTLRTGYAPNPILVKDMITKKLSAKDVAGLMDTKGTFVNHTGATVTASILTHPEVLQLYTPKLLKRIGEEMSTSDIQTIRDVIEDAGTTPGASPQITKLAAWLSTPDGDNFS